MAEQNMKGNMQQIAKAALGYTATGISFDCVVPCSYKRPYTPAPPHDQPLTPHLTLATLRS